MNKCGICEEGWYKFNKKKRGGIWGFICLDHLAEVSPVSSEEHQSAMDKLWNMANRESDAAGFAENQLEKIRALDWWDATIYKDLSDIFDEYDTTTLQRGELAK